jgi:Histone-binding protein RBBP4 or subunit C of CAF1 complex
MNHVEPTPTEEEMQEQMLVNEEYKIWKKHTPLLYDLLYS